jgi:hypothetical protein
LWQSRIWSSRIGVGRWQSRHGSDCAAKWAAPDQSRNTVRAGGTGSDNATQIGSPLSLDTAGGDRWPLSCPYRHV